MISQIEALKSSGLSSFEATLEFAERNSIEYSFLAQLIKKNAKKLFDEIQKECIDLHMLKPSASANT